MRYEEGIRLNEILLQVEGGVEDIRIRFAQATQPLRNSGAQPLDMHWAFPILSECVFGGGSGGRGAPVLLVGLHYTYHLHCMEE